MVGLFLAIAITIALTALGSSDLMKHVLEWLGLQDVPGVGVALRVASLADVRADLVVAVHLDHRAVASGVGQLPQCGSGGTAGRGGLRGLQTGGIDLPAIGR